MDTSQLKANFKFPDKLGASAITIAIAIAALWGFWMVKDILIELAEDTIYLTGMALVLVIGLSTLWQSREAIWYWQQNQVRKIRRAIIAEDPVGILKSVISRMQNKENELRENIEKARAALQRLKKQRDDFMVRCDKQKGMAEAARDAGKDEADIEVYVLGASRWEKASRGTQPTIDMLTDMASKFQEALVVCRRSIADATNQAEVLDATRTALNEGQATVKGFRAFFGRSQELTMHREAVAEIELQASQAEASIDQFLRDITPMMEEENLQRQADAKTAMAKFGGFLNKAPQGALPGGGVVNGEVVMSATQKESVK